MIETRTVDPHRVMAAQGIVGHWKEWYRKRESIIQEARDQLQGEGYVSAVWVSHKAKYPDGRYISRRAITLLRRLAGVDDRFQALSVVIDGSPRMYYRRDQLNAMLEAVKEGGSAAVVP